MTQPAQSIETSNPNIESAEPLNALLDALKAYSGTARLSDPSSVASRYIGLKRCERLSADLVAGMRDEVMAYLSDGEVLEHEGKIIMLQTSKPRESCDWKGFVKAHPSQESAIQRFVKQGEATVSVVVRDKE